MKKILLLLLTAVVNALLGAGCFVFMAVLYVGVIVAAGGTSIGIGTALLLLVGIAVLVTLVNWLLLHWTKLRVGQYVLLALPTFLAGMVVYFLYAMYLV